MATCQSCGSEVNAPYCPNCGALVQEERSTKPTKASSKTAAKASEAAADVTPETAPAVSPKAARKGGALSAGRIWRTTGVAVIGLAIFGAGIVTGFYLDGRYALAGDTSAAISAEDAKLPPSVLGGKFMDQGADLMTQGKKVSAMATFRRAINQYQKALTENPDDLYAKSYMALTYFYMGDDKLSFDTMAEVLKKDPNYLWGIFNLAWMDESTGKTADAIMLYQKYIDIAPSEKANVTKYAEQAELIDSQTEAAKAAITKLQGEGTKQ